jgi:hypothetical protein
VKRLARPVPYLEWLEIEVALREVIPIALKVDQMKSLLKALCVTTLMTMMMTGGLIASTPRALATLDLVRAATATRRKSLHSAIKIRWQLV